MEDMLYKISNKEDFLIFIKKLAVDKKDRNIEWENKDISSYLIGVSSWVEDMEGYYINMGLEMPSDINWQFIATLFYVGKIYE